MWQPWCRVLSSRDLFISRRGGPFHIVNIILFCVGSDKKPCPLIKNTRRAQIDIIVFRFPQPFESSLLSPLFPREKFKYSRLLFSPPEKGETRARPLGEIKRRANKMRVCISRLKFKFNKSGVKKLFPLRECLLSRLYSMYFLRGW